MRYTNRFSSPILMLILVSSLISCTTKSSFTKPPIDLTDMPLPQLTPTILNSPAPTIFVPTITVSPSTTPFLIQEGRFLFEAYIPKNGTRYPVIKLKDIKNNTFGSNCRGKSGSKWSRGVALLSKHDLVSRWTLVCLRRN